MILSVNGTWYHGALSTGPDDLSIHTVQFSRFVAFLQSAWKIVCRTFVYLNCLQHFRDSQYKTRLHLLISIVLSILKKWLIVGSSAPSHLDFGILRFRTNIWNFIAFR